ncbi:hypothetical protein, variant 1 [Aphanomyces invadans]|uniref:Sugar phosphate transporter domain-containing protein n=1 Tax=Aphanomyces invadans TaxID=157072 RepID=A0A024TTK6_9STRA|nr:hypothetical protein, variant 1 [Aphanomyces invadans]ETV97475.1 hypothetical protein, variant 1 [Aphanomyces invadans]|eukprot:XP_008873685.1 hypothetical protein, variant 1 [Aphanomyces invadans]
MAPPLAIFGWCASSALSGVTSKQILQEYPHAFILSAWQFTVAFACHAWYTALYHPTAIFQRSENPRAHMWLVLSAFVYSVGVCSFNAGFWAMHVSINETMRALEPLVSVTLAATFLRDPQLSRLRLGALIPIVAGVYLSAMSNAAFSIAGMAIAMLANISFPLRSALVKRIQPFMPLHVMFYSTLYYAMLLQWVLAGLWSVFGNDPAASRAVASANFKEFLFSVFNGVFFYLYHWCGMLCAA